MRCCICGSESSEKPFVGPICIDCYKPRVKKAEAQMTACSTCGRVRTKDGWVGLSKEEIAELLKKAIKAEGEVVSLDIEAGEAEVEVETDRGKARKKIPASISISKGQCVFCTRKSSGYFTSIVQLRGPPSKVEKAKRVFIHSARKYLVKEEEQKTGVDLYFSETEKVREIIKEHGYPLVSSPKLAGRKAGKALFRITFLVRLGD
ncbi:MAG: NMD3-related protein [Candidatus Anstonellales archaeon]